MAKLNGHSGTVKLGGSTTIQVSKWNATVDLPELDVTDSSSNGWQNVIVGTKKASGSFSTFIDAQTLSTFINGTVGAIELKIGSSSQKLSGNGLITAAAIDNTVGSPVACVCNFVSDGEWQFGTIS